MSARCKRRAPNPHVVWAVTGGGGHRSFLEKGILGQFSGTLNNFLIQARLNHLKMSCNFMWSSIIECYHGVQVLQVRSQNLTSGKSYNSIFCHMGPQIKRPPTSQYAKSEVGQIPFLNFLSSFPSFADCSAPKSL